MNVLSSVFRAKFVDGLRRHSGKGKLVFSGSIAAASRTQSGSPLLSIHFSSNEWVVYAKPAFGGPTQVLRYLGRYTHRVAISNHRLLAFDGEHVTFRWKDYAHGNKQKKMTLEAMEFLRRFTQHILPRGFVRIRQFGFLDQHPTVCPAGTSPASSSLLDAADRSLPSSSSRQDFHLAVPSLQRRNADRTESVRLPTGFRCRLLDSS